MSLFVWNGSSDSPSEFEPLTQKNDELILILVVSVKTAKSVGSKILIRMLMRRNNFTNGHSCSIFCGSSLLELIGERLLRRPASWVRLLFQLVAVSADQKIGSPLTLEVVLLRIAKVVLQASRVASGMAGRPADSPSHATRASPSAPITTA